MAKFHFFTEKKKKKKKKSHDQIRGVSAAMLLSNYAPFS